MLFNSIDFGVFFPAVFVLYWFVTRRNLKLQNSLIIGASYVFYGWWDSKFLLLIVLSTVVDYAIGRMLENEKREKRRKALLWSSIIINLGILGYFKYANFFIENFATAFTFFGGTIGAESLNLILPVGISFYTFQTMSYTIDVYRGKLQPTRDFIAFAAFVSFFPQLVAGPIERATNLLPQMTAQRTFSRTQATEGLRMFIWGLFRKVVIADNLAPSVEAIFSDYENMPPSILLLGALFFSLQIYGDFSGYSFMARGTAKMLGMELMVNFNFPYFSRNIGEFWRRWHISLSTWFRDYVYIPLGGSRVPRPQAIRNIFIIFLVSGFWHGANWTFIAWGAFHALLFVPSFIFQSNRKFTNQLPPGKLGLPSWADAGRILLTFSAVTLGWIFLRSDSLMDAWGFIAGIFTHSTPDGFVFYNPYDNQPLGKEYVFIGLFFVLEYLAAINWFQIMRPAGKWWDVWVDAILLVLIVLNTPIAQNTAFIYFQF